MRARRGQKENVEYKGKERGEEKRVKERRTGSTESRERIKTRLRCRFQARRPYLAIWGKVGFYARAVLVRMCVYLFVQLIRPA